ncbi:uncharacterized protein K452DRAFT_323229 [Aplosporella prunicola CBS 121167]|uniref:DUF1593-domain-containing protein n=1 Tax=Aplosporella prunicola CBS 121167 TaxID=1176127 RepID=A0A6A6AV66_9PEZI|nr:uncharacterized protein K452DRAFT_323229 [Aplosporella prunicola CBS 121167]KAF2135098.1 hypothetical protein K452DRAFT_323229 [Aplosporella prunicola CBS 121167]
MLLEHVLTHFFAISVFALLVTAQSDNKCEDARYTSKQRVFVFTDINNEPDDQMSLVRFLIYANEMEIEGIAAVTSAFLLNSTDAPTIRNVITAYGNVTENLNGNVPSSNAYPSAEELLKKVYKGHSVYGLESLKQDPSAAALALIDAVDKSEKPLWITAWGGLSVLAEALNKVSNNRSANDTTTFVKKLRVYSISDQDDAGPWIREHFPALFYIVSIHAFTDFSQASWNGIGGEDYRHFDKGGPDTSLVTNDWLEQHIRVGVLGASYLNYSYVMEGDTPSFLPLIQNGLGDPEHPEYGSWGGRYKLIDSSGRTQTYGNTADYVYGKSGEPFYSSFATIWRWRKAYQHDFAARMQWTVNADYKKNNHHPVVVLNGTCGPAAYEVTYKAGGDLVLDASASWDPDDDDLVFSWQTYRDITAVMDGTRAEIFPNVTVTNMNEQGSIVKVTPPSLGLTMHLILSVEDKRDMGLTTYRRIVLSQGE